MAKSKLALFAIVAYVGYEIYGIVQFCKPPFIARNHPNAVGPQFKPTDELQFDLYLFPKKDKKNRHLIASFVTNATWSSEFTDHRTVENFTIPWEDKNQTVIAEVVALANGKEFKRKKMTLSRYLVAARERDGKRDLLDDPSGDKQRERISKFGLPKPLSSIPPVMEVGFVLEEEHLDGSNLQQRGFAEYLQQKHFEMPLYLNTFVIPRDEYLPCDQTFPFELRFRVIGFGFWMAQKLLTDSFAEAESTMGMNSYDIDSFKTLISGSSPWKLIVVYTVALLHLIFEYMVITADISFWKAKTSFEGLSKDSISMSIVMKLISALYVIEDGKSKLILYFLLARLSLDVWKWLKMNKANREKWEEGLEEMRDVTQSEKKLMTYTFLALTPLVLSFVAYRLTHETFKSWYSFFVLTLAAVSNMFGFVIMLPQVFLNYRLKSVEHLPWRALSYQAVNTFIDDVFTLCIRMPEVQKYSAFRDDIVFIICLYQRYLYKKRREEATPLLSPEDNKKDPRNITEGEPKEEDEKKND